MTKTKGTDNTRETVKIMNCDCRQSYQDAKYGTGKRVHNLAVKKEQYRCTGCGKLR